MNHFMGDWATAAVMARVFGADVRMLLRRIAAAGVQLGNAELAQTRRNNKREGRR
ncbi:hypothetical protein SAMN05428940_3772 [Streptomyces sp. 2133.1]|nr:hypothetical protein SAMN05428940_3772 [Streptomyces sp. 2133.1]